MGMPLQWHKRHAMMIAGQLPENLADARLVVEAVTELLETFLATAPDVGPVLASNVLPFAAG